MELKTIAALQSARRFAIGLCALSLAAILLGLAFAPQRVWISVLLVSYALVGLGLGSSFFIAVTTLSGGAWARPLQPIAALLSRALMPGSIGMLAVIALHPSIYVWTHEGEHLGEGFKAFWLSYPFFLIRTLVYLAIWNLLAAGIAHRVERDRGAGGCHTDRRLARLSAGFIVVFAATYWLASFDWIMSLEPHWISTIFGIYNFAGLFVAALAVMIMGAIWLDRAGLVAGLTADRLHDLGKLLFAFTTFWMYIWFSQYMLIWYTNFPEEAGHFTRRLSSGWAALFITNLLLNWVVPFLVLLPRAAKRSPAVLVRVSALVLVGRWLDLYLMIAPTVQPAPAFGVPEIAGVTGGLGLVLLLVIRGYRRPAAAAPSSGTHTPSLEASPA